jgi:hypothetical protein
MVNGDVDPAIGAHERTTGIRSLTASRMIWVDWVHSFRG